MSNQNKLNKIKEVLETASASLDAARQMLTELTGGKDDSVNDHLDEAKKLGSLSVSDKEKIVEGVFDGQNMIGPDGKQYSVPANYASKSKLVEGDTLKLTITADGSFIYKQIGPIERVRLVGILTKDKLTDEYRVLASDKTYKVLLASITYFKGEEGDEVVILVPKDKESQWAAVENIIKKLGNNKTENESMPVAEAVQAQKATEADNIDDLE